MAITIDPASKRLILDSTGVTAQAIYAAWVDWVALADNAKYPPAFRSAGGVVRPLTETLRRTLADEVARGVDRGRRSGLTAAEEADILDSLG